MHLAAIHLLVLGTMIHQLLVGTYIVNSSIIEHDDLVSIHYRGYSLRNNNFRGFR